MKMKAVSCCSYVIAWPRNSMKNTLREIIALCDKEQTGIIGEELFSAVVPCKKSYKSFAEIPCEAPPSSSAGFCFFRVPLEVERNPEQKAIPPTSLHIGNTPLDRLGTSQGVQARLDKMRKILFVAVLFFLIFAAGYVHSKDWTDEGFISPVRCKGSIPVRKDEHGDGHFGAPRKGGRSHRGLDIYAPLGTSVKASKSGRAKVGYVKNGMGKYVLIHHANGCVTLYGHLSGSHVKNNQNVRQGAVIGYVGKTGNAKYKDIDPHLHFEIRMGGRCVDPLPLIR